MRFPPSSDPECRVLEHQHVVADLDGLANDHALAVVRYLPIDGARKPNGVPSQSALLGSVRGRIREDLDAAIERDPAVDSRLEMALTSPGLHAIWVHRVTHCLWTKPGGRLAARLLSQLARAITGVEIHPGAQIGRRFFIAGRVLAEKYGYRWTAQ